MAKNLRKKSWQYRLRTRLRQLPTIDELDRWAANIFVALMIGACLGGGVWLAGEVIDDLTAEAVVFIDPADGTLEKGEEWKIHKIVTWSDEIKEFVEVPSSSPVWNEILERGDYNVSYAWDQSGHRFPPMPE